MGRIQDVSKYPFDTVTPTVDDYVIGTDVNDLLRTKNYKIGDILSLALGGASDFVSLTDTPGTYAAQGGKFVAVNVGATALEFVDPPSGGDNLGNHTATTTLDMANNSVVNVNALSIIAGGLGLRAVTNEGPDIGTNTSKFRDLFCRNIILGGESITYQGTYGSRLLAVDETTGVITYNNEPLLPANASSTPSVTTSNNTLFTTAPTNVTLDLAEGSEQVTFTANFTENSVSLSASTDYLYIGAFTITGIQARAEHACSVAIDDTHTNVFNGNSLLSSRLLPSGANTVVQIYLKVNSQTTGVLGLKVSVSCSFLKA